MTANYLDHTFFVPEWIERKSMNDRLNYIVAMYSETCGDNWYLWIEAAVESLPILIISLLAISKVDVVKEVLEHKYSCGLRQALTAGKKVPSTRWQKAKTFFWKIEGVRGKLFWYWLIAESVTAYVMNWQSIVVNEEHCAGPAHAGPCILDTPGSTLGAGIGSTSLFWLHREFDPSGWSGTGGTPTVINPHAVGKYNVGASVSAIWPGAPSVTWHLQLADGNGTVIARSADVTGPGSQEQHASCFAQSTPTTVGQAQYIAQVVTTAMDGVHFGSCPTGTFSVGVFNI